MTTLNDLKRQFYLDSGISSAPLNEMEMKWLFQQGATSGTLNDRWMAYLAGEGYTTGSIQDRMFKWLGGLGYTGSLTDRFWNYYSMPVSFSVSPQTLSIGSETLSGAGAITPIYLGSPTGAFQITGGQSANYNVDSVTGAVTPSSNHSAVDGDTFQWGDGTTFATMTIDAEANAYDFVTGEELDTAIADAHGANTATDWIFYAREGDIGRTSGDRTIITGEIFDGTITEPNDGATKATLNKSATTSVSGGSMHITCRTQLGAVWGDHSLELIGSGPFIIDKIDFQRLSSTAGYNRDDGGPETSTLGNSTTKNIIVTTNGSFPTRSGGVIRNLRMGGTAADNPGGTKHDYFCTGVDVVSASTVVVEDCEFDGFYNAVSGSTVDLWIVRRNSFKQQLTDSIRCLGGDNTVVPTVEFQCHNNTVFSMVDDGEDWGGAHPDGIQVGSTVAGSPSVNVIITENYLYMDADATVNIYAEQRTSQGIWMDDIPSPDVITGDVYNNMIAVMSPNAIGMWRGNNSDLRVHNNTAVKCNNIGTTSAPFSTPRLWNREVGSPLVWDNIAGDYISTGGTPIYEDNATNTHESQVDADRMPAVFDGTFVWDAGKDTYTYTVDETSASTVRSSLDTLFTPTTGQATEGKGHLSNNPIAIIYDWSAATGSGNAELDITITTLPDLGGETITQLQYRLDGGTWTNLGGTTATTYTITAGAASTSYDIEVRAISSSVNGPSSETITATSGVAGFSVDEGSSTGTFSSSGGFRVWEADNGDALVVTGAGEPTGIEFIAGGGAGGYRVGGGGGAGELIQDNSTPPSFTVQTYTATVGAGGAANTNQSINGGDGGDTELVGGTSDDISLIALGGGGGGTISTGSGSSGGSGGGGGALTSATGGASTASDGIGNAGGGSASTLGGGGGGGSAGAGVTATTATGAAGGAGTASIAPGVSETVCAGGTGGDQTSSGNPSDPTIPGTGGDGGGGTFGFRDSASGAAGKIRVWWPE